MLLGPRCFSQEPRTRPGPAACGEQEPLTSFVLPWERHWEGGDRKRKKQLCVSQVSMGCSQGGSSQTGPPLQDPSLLRPSLLHPVPLPRDRGAGSRWARWHCPSQRLPSATAPSWENFPSAWKATGACGSQEQLQALYPLYFPPAGHVASGQHLWLPAVSCSC